VVRWIKIYSYYARKNSNNIFSENNTAETNVEFKRFRVGLSYLMRNILSL
jgi:hypothetical protein